MKSYTIYQHRLKRDFEKPSVLSCPLMLHPGASSICIIIKSPLLDEMILHLTALKCAFKKVNLFILSSFEMSKAPPSLFQWPPVVGLCIVASGKAHFLSNHLYIRHWQQSRPVHTGSLSPGLLVLI